MFRTKAARTFKKSIGESDAFMEWIEVATRELVERYSQEQGKENVEALAKHHGVCVHAVDFGELSHRLAQLQIVAIYQHFEVFLKDFVRNHPKRVGVGGRKDGDSVIFATLRSFGLHDDPLANSLQYKIVDHYRSVRNKITHDGARPNEELLESGKLLKQKVLEDGNYCKLSAPNPPGKLSFDDFVLFTRAAKDFADLLCQKTSPSDDELKDLLFGETKLVKKAKNKEPRAEKLLAAFLREQYSIESERADSIAKAALADGLLAQR